jgi:hypothetical protein
MYYYNSVQWEQLDSDCEDVYTCNTAAINITKPVLMDNTSIPFFTDGIANIETYDAGVQQKLQMNGNNDDRVNIAFSDVLSVGTKIALYYNTSQQPGFCGIRVRQKLNGVNGTVYRTTQTLVPNATNNPVGDPANNNFVLTITLLGPSDAIWIQSDRGRNNANKVYFTEVKLFDANDVEIPIICAPDCLDLSITITNPFRMNPAITIPLLTDNLVHDNEQTVNWQSLELTDDTTDVVNFNFNDILPVGYKVLLYFYNGAGGIEVDLKNGASIHQNFVSNSLPINASIAATPGGVGFDKTMTITLEASTDSVVVYDGPSSNFNYLFEIRVLDLDGNIVPFSCP